MRRTFWISTALLLFAASAYAAPPRTHALLGNWVYDASGSSFDGGVPYLSGTMHFEAVAGGIRVQTQVVLAVGKGMPVNFEYVDPADGSFAAVVGNPLYDSESTVWSRDGCERKERRAGKVVGVNEMKLSKDHGVLTSKATRSRADGTPYVAVTVWKRAT